MNQDEEHLRILSIFHYVVAGIAAVFGSFPIIHLLIGLTFITGGAFMGGAAGDDLPAGFFTLFGLMFTLIPAFIILLGWSFAVAMALAGRWLGRHEGYMFCLVMAGIACAFVPFGTALGVFTIVVLTRPSVKALFGVDSPPATAEGTK